MKANLAVFLFCGGFILVFLCFVLIIFKYQSKSDSSAFHNSEDLSTTQANVISDEVLSLPPCHSYGGKLWLHHTSGECYEVGTQGPCGESMTFYRNPLKTLTTVGFCDCDDIVEVKSDIPECEVIQRPLLYYPEHNSCYPVFNQGPCADGMWLVLGQHRNAVCQPDLCSSLKSNSPAYDDYSVIFWFAEGERCYRTETRGYCPPGYILRVIKNSWKPECQKDTNDDCIVTEEVSIASLQCRPGNRLYSLSMCPIIRNYTNFD